MENLNITSRFTNERYQEIKPELLESMVIVLGEKYREKISKRLENLYINNYYSFYDIAAGAEINSYKNNLNLAINFLKKIGVDISEEQIEKINTIGYSELGNENIKKIEKFFKPVNQKSFGYTTVNSNGRIYLWDDKLTEDIEEIIKNRCKALEEMYDIKVEPDNYYNFIKTEQGKRVMSEIEIAHSVAIEIRQQQDEFDIKNNKVTEYINNCKKLYQEIDLKYCKEFYKKIEDFVPEKTKRKFEEVLSLEKDMTADEFINLIDKNNIYGAPERYDRFTNKEGAISYFTKELDEEIKRTSVLNDKIKRERINYFKAQEIDLGNEYSNYINNEDVKKIIPSKEMIDKIEEIRNEVKRNKELDFISKTGNYLGAKEKLDKLNLKFDYFIPEVVKQLGRDETIAFCFYNVKEQNEKKDLYSVLNFIEGKNLDGKNIKGYEDVCIIHEILHHVEGALIEDKSDTSSFKVGISKVEINKDIRKNIESGNILLYENLHQHLAEKITKIFHSRGNFILDDLSSAKEKGLTNYEHYDILTDEFRTKYEDKIIDTFMSDKEEDIFNLLTREEFEEFEAIITEFESNFSKIQEDSIDDISESYGVKNKLIQRKNELMKKIDYRNINSQNLGKYGVIEEHKFISDLKNNINSPEIAEINSDTRSLENEQINVQQEQPEINAPEVS